MKLFQIVSIISVIVSFSSLVSIANATVQFYGAETDLDSSGNAKVKLTITFEQATKQFQLAIFGRISNFQAETNAGPTDCEVTASAASIIDCKLNLTKDKRTLEIWFESKDFVRSVDGKSLFSLDLSLNDNITQAFASVKLPEGYALTNTSLISTVLPSSASIISDGRRIIVNWNLANITAEQPFKFQVLHEPVGISFPTTYVSAGVISAIVILALLFYFFKRIKKPEEVILSVLDDFERKVIEVITNAGGEIHQRKVVQETNLSKAKVSRVIKRLQERGLLEVVRLGRTNKLKIVKEKFREFKPSI